MCQYSGTFLKSRFIEEFFPIIEKLYLQDFSSISKKSLKTIVNSKQRYNVYSNDVILEISLLKMIPKLVYHFDFHGVNLNFLTYFCVKFLINKFPFNVKKVNF